MSHVRDCVNSNAHLYRDLVDPVDLPEHEVDEAWAERNFAIREFYLVKEDGKFVATGSYQDLGDFAYMGYLYVKPERQRAGIGRLLVSFLEARALLDEKADLRLFCHPRAHWALSFYEKVGFREVTRSKEEILGMNGGVLAPFYEQDAVLFSKELRAPPACLL